MKTASGPIRGFDGVRAIAVTAVILTHLGIHSRVVESGLLGPGVASAIDGSAGVQAFFVLSGFLITHLLVREHRSAERVSLTNFYLRRCLRIVPIYLLVVTATLVMHVMVGEVANGRSFAHAYTYTYNFIPDDHYAVALGHTWSLAVEEHFYLVWPFVFAAAAARFRPLMIALLAFVPAMSVFHTLAERSAALTEEFFVYRWSFFAGINIALGCIGALVLNEPRRPASVDWLVGTRAGLAVGVALWFASALPLVPDHTVLGYVRALGFLVLICWIFTNQESLLVRFLDLPPIRYVGTISYGLYMYQGFYLTTRAARDPDHFWPLDPVIGLLLLVVTAPLSYHFVERPILGMKHRLQRRDRPA